MSKREKAQYLQRHPDKVPQLDQRTGRSPRQNGQMNADGERYTLLMEEIQELRNQRATRQPQESPGPKA